MKTLAEIAAEATQSNVRLQLDVDALARAARATVDGLFHTPLLAITILVITRTRRSGLPTSDMATWTLATLVKRFEALRLARGRIQWSVLLRRRCADALVFLENIELAGVREVPVRTVYVTPKGRAFISGLASRADEGGTLVRQLERAHRSIVQSGLELL